MTQTRHDAAPPGAPRLADPSSASRESNRRNLATALKLDPAMLRDDAHLVNDLALDSLAMMTVVTWLEARGVGLGTEHHTLIRVGDVLTLLDRLPASPRVSLVVTGTPDGRTLDGPHSAADLTTLPAPPLPSPALAPELSSRVFRLSPIEPGDVGFLFALAVQPQTSFRWRYRGSPPSLERFSADLWTQVLVQYVVRRVTDDERIGHVVAYAADLGQGYAYLGAVFAPQQVGTGLAAQTVLMFVRYLFHTFPLRKLYLEVPGFNWPLVRSAAGNLFEVEGVLREHDFYAGRHWDKYLCATYRDRVLATGTPGS